MHPNLTKKPDSSGDTQGLASGEAHRYVRAWGNLNIREDMRMVLWAYWEISVFCSVLGALPLFYISAWLLAHIGITSFSMQVIVTALLFLTPSLAYLYYGYSFRCPRCGQRFLGVMLASRSLPPDTCVHCGLKRDEVPEEILTRL